MPTRSLGPPAPPDAGAGRVGVRRELVVVRRLPAAEIELTRRPCALASRPIPVPARACPLIEELRAKQRAMGIYAQEGPRARAQGWTPARVARALARARRQGRSAQEKS